MPSITLKNVPDDLYADLKQAAERERRSINSEVIVCIERALRSQKMSVEESLARARQIREHMRGHVITDEEFNEAKAAGRP